jgi:hypothetical protein
MGQSIPEPDIKQALRLERKHFKLFFRTVQCNQSSISPLITPQSYILFTEKSILHANGKVLT